jgi:AcrR family transcriptional regulator
MGHRAEKQRQQRSAIIANTIALIRASGAAPVRVSDIAERSGISDATFFNYFASKDAVLREWADDVVDAALAEAAARQAEGMALRRAVRWLADRLAARAREEGELLGAALRLARVVPAWEEAGPDRGRPRRRDAARQLMERARDRGEVRSDVPAAELGAALRAVVVSAMAQGLSREAGDALEATALAARVRGATDVLLDGMRKRNERVRAPLSAGAARDRGTRRHALPPPIGPD